MPLVTFLGPFRTRRRPDSPDEWERNKTEEVSQDWLETHRNAICGNPTAFRVEGDEGVTVDGGNDGVPDNGWTKKDISAWLKAQGAGVGGYATKSKLLGLVEQTLNPPAPEPEPVAEEVPEEVPVEEALTDLPEQVEETQITGDEE